MTVLVVISFEPFPVAGAAASDLGRRNGGPGGAVLLCEGARPAYVFQRTRSFRRVAARRAARLPLGGLKVQVQILL